MRIEYQLEIAKMRTQLANATRDELYEMCIALLTLNYNYREVASKVMKQEFPPITPP